jgi:hypothetical protein
MDTNIRQQWVREIKCTGTNIYRADWNGSDHFEYTCLTLTTRMHWQRGLPYNAALNDKRCRPSKGRDFNFRIRELENVSVFIYISFMSFFGKFTWQVKEALAVNIKKSEHFFPRTLPKSLLSVCVSRITLLCIYCWSWTSVYAYNFFASGLVDHKYEHFNNNRFKAITSVDNLRFTLRWNQQQRPDYVLSMKPVQINFEKSLNNSYDGFSVKYAALPGC